MDGLSSVLFNDVMSCWE